MPAMGNGAPVANTTQQLAVSARKQDVSSVLGLRFYYRACEMLLKQCNDFRKEGDKNNLFVQLMRFSSMMIETIPRHVEYNKGQDPHYKLLHKKLMDSMVELEQLKKEINTAAAEFESRKRMQASAAAAQAKASAVRGDHTTGLVVRPPAPVASVTGAELDQLYRGQLGGAGPTPTPAPAGSNGGMPAVPTAVPQYVPSPGFEFLSSGEALQRHSLVPPPPSSAPASTAQQRRPPLQPDAPLYPTFDASPADMPRLDPYRRPAPAAPTPTPSAPPQPPVQVAMPVAPGQQQQQQLAPAQVAMPAPTYPPNLGPQLVEVNQIPETAATLGPLPPGHHTCSHPHVPAPPRPESPAGQQLVPRDAGAGVGEESPPGGGLWAVHISKHMMEEFLAIATANTRNNLETCAILSGSNQRKDGVYYVDHLIIPKQKATSDSCEMVKEEEIWEAQMSRELMPLGWIHTHPTQTCFMSSIDVHTHVGYQTMLDEAMAIVMAPTDRTRSYGIFRLSTPHGLKQIQQCEQRGFHPHDRLPDGAPLYHHTEHVYINPTVECKTIDLRPL